MARLVSEDHESVSSIEIIKGPTRSLHDQRWQRFSLILVSGNYRIPLGLEGSSENEQDACMLCRSPEDEVLLLVTQLQELADFDRDKVLFEPAEPSFELSVARSGITGLRVSIWLDAGNAKTGIYRWDAAGIRFYTLQEHLVDFVKELRTEFAC